MRIIHWTASGAALLLAATLALAVAQRDVPEGPYRFILTTTGNNRIVDGGEFELSSTSIAATTDGFDGNREVFTLAFTPSLGDATRQIRLARGTVQFLDGGQIDTGNMVMKFRVQQARTQRWRFRGIFAIRLTSGQDEGQVLRGIMRAISI